MRTGAAHCVCVCACMQDATGALSQAALPGARGGSVAKTSNPPRPLAHTSLPLRHQNARADSTEIRSWPDKGALVVRQRRTKYKKGREGWGDKAGKTDGDECVCVYVDKVSGGQVLAGCGQGDAVP